VHYLPNTGGGSGATRTVVSCDPPTGKVSVVVGADSDAKAVARYGSNGLVVGFGNQLKFFVPGRACLTTAALPLPPGGDSNPEPRAMVYGLWALPDALEVFVATSRNLLRYTLGSGAVTQLAHVPYVDFKDTVGHAALMGDADRLYATSENETITWYDLSAAKNASGLLTAGSTGTIKVWDGSDFVDFVASGNFDINKNIGNMFNAQFYRDYEGGGLAIRPNGGSTPTLYVSTREGDIFAVQDHGSTATVATSLGGAIRGLAYNATTHKLYATSYGGGNTPSGRLIEFEFDPISTEPLALPISSSVTDLSNGTLDDPNSIPWGVTIGPNGQPIVAENSSNWQRVRTWP
jgi:hypothetical protein